jgi:hypothetical protein
MHGSIWLFAATVIALPFACGGANRAAGGDASGGGGAAGTSTRVVGTGGIGDQSGVGGAGTGGARTVDASESVAQDAAVAEVAPPTPATCGPLAVSAGTVVKVDPAQAPTLHERMLGAAAGTTFLLAPGTYAIAGSLRLEKPNMVLRSSTDQAADVIIDAGYQVSEAIVVTASNVTVAHVTVTHASAHAIHVYPPSEGVDVTGTVIYGVTLTDHSEQFIKVNPLGTAAGYLDGGRVECSRFVMTDAGRTHVQRDPGGCYTGGIDVHAGRDWVVRGNRFDGIYCAGEGLAEHAVHFWRRSRGTLVENNVIINCARGVGFGMGDTNTGSRTYPDAPDVGDVGHIDGIIRNNVIFADIDYFDTGIEITQAAKPIVVHNTILSWKGAGFFSSIDYRFARTQAVIRNNIVRRITVRDGAMGAADHNLESVGEAYFVNPGQRDFHLTSVAVDAIDHGVVLPEAGLDMDGAPHTHGAPDLGADER